MAEGADVPMVLLRGCLVVTLQQELHDQAAERLQSRTVLVGLKPAVAITLCELGLDLPGIHTDLDLERGLEWIQRQLPQSP